VPSWLVDVFSQLSPEGSITSFVGTIATFVALVIVKVMQERKKLDKAMQSIPPTVCPAPDTMETTIAHARQIWELETQLRDARADRDKVAADASRIAQALAASENRAQSLAGELARIRRAIEGGHTRITVRGMDAVEVDETPTPPRGTRVPR